MRVVIVTEGRPDRISGGFLYQNQIRDGARDHGVDVRYLSIPAWPLPAATLIAPVVLWRARRTADVIVIDSLASAATAALLGWLRRSGRDVIGSVHQRPGGTVGRPGRRRWRARADRRAWNACRTVIVPSRYLADQLRTHGVRTPAVVVTPGRDLPVTTAAATTAAATSDRTELTGPGLAVLCVANWLPGKGIVELIEAVAALPAGTATLHLVGDEHVDPAYRTVVIDRLEALGATNRVVRHGLVPTARMAGFYEQADVFAMASHEESYGMVYGEALSAGLPVVGYAAGNVVNLVEHGVEGLLVPRGDIAALTDALRALAADPALGREMGAAARRRADRLPSWTTTVAEFVAVCRAEPVGNR